MIYLLQVQEGEGCIFRNLYYETETALKEAVKTAKKTNQIRHFNANENKFEIIPVHVMRTFKMIRRIKCPNMKAPEK